MSDLASRIIDDLRAFSADLLQAGIDERGPRSPSAGASRESSLLHAIKSLTALVPRLLSELETADTPVRYEETVAATPKGASLSRRPADYQLRGGHVIPRRWVRMTPLPEESSHALRYLLFLLDRQRDALLEVEERSRKRIDEALAARRGSSAWAKADAHRLRALTDGLEETRARLDRSINSVRRRAGARAIATARTPSPYPPTQSWVALRRLAPGLLDPQARLPAHLTGLLNRDAAIADLPYLYQRWCGLKIVEALHDLRWEVQADPVGAIFLGGLITFERDGHSLDLWVEPRLQRSGGHASGFRCARGVDATPDYMFVTPGPGGPDAFILDATLQNAGQDHVAKGRYLDLIELGHLVRVAGCPIKRQPRLAWAAAPILAAHNKTLRADGAIGTVPMNPLRWNAEPIRDWVHDVTRHALAWSLAESGHSPRAERN